MKSVHAALILCALSELAIGLVIDSHSVRTRNPEINPCDATVAYVFLAREHLPLWPVWQTYFEGCPKGSFTVLVHTQTPGAAYGNKSLVGVSSVGGKELPESQVVQGEMRFNWNMVEAMLQLYGGVKSAGAAPNKCKPHWVQMLSDGCAPVQHCSTYHNYLSLHAGKSFVEQVHSAPPSETLRKSAQWTTLWWEHANALWDDRDKIRDYWSQRGSDVPAQVVVVDGQSVETRSIEVDGIQYHGALDEFVTATELKKRHADFKRKTLTYIEMCRDGHADTFSKDEDVARVFRTAAEKQQRSEPTCNLQWRKKQTLTQFFARKFDATPEVVTQLRSLFLHAT